MPLSWGRRYCVYKYQGFLFYIVTLVLSNVHAFRIGSFPVSYTHLDVYKRQVYMGAKNYIYICES